MANILQYLTDKSIAHPPEWLNSNVLYMTIAGSRAYATHTDESDYDVVGVVMPKVNHIFPHLGGELLDFDTQKERFGVYTEKGLKHPNGQEWSFDIYSIVKFFRLITDCNPNVLETLFTTRENVIYTNQIGEYIRENRRLFFHKGVYHKCKGFAYSMLHKCKTKEVEGKRKAIRDQFGWDTKYGMNCLRLLNYAEQILLTGDLDLHQEKEQLKAIRRGEVSYERVVEIFNEKEKYLEQLYQTSTIPHSPDNQKVKTILLNCIEMHYGSIDKYIRVEGKEEQCIGEIRKVLANYGY